MKKKLRIIKLHNLMFTTKFFRTIRNIIGLLKRRPLGIISLIQIRFVLVML